MFSQILVNSIVAGSTYALLAIGYYLIYSGTKFFNLTYGAIAISGGYLAFFFAKILGWNLALSIAFAIIGAGCLGLLLNLIIFEPLRRHRSSNTVLLVAGIGAMTIIRSSLAIAFTSQFQTLSDNSTIGTIYSISSATITQTQVLIVLSALAVFIISISILKLTPFGKMVRALNDNEEMAEIIGINTRQIIRYLFFIGSAIAGFAGILIGFDTGLEPNMGIYLFLKGSIAPIIGGLHSIAGAMIGSYILGLVENFGVWRISGEWKDALAFGLLIIFLLLRPKGIYAK
jgi:branched-subunit amino acid ABC-type transport system permease component